MEIDVLSFESYGLSYFLAKFFGIYFLIIALLFIIRKEAIKNIVNRIVEDDGLLALSGTMSLMIGIAVVVSHSVFESNWRILITLIGYLSLVKGILRLGFVETSKSMIRKMMGKNGLTITLVVMLIVSIILIFYGFIF